jgi:hypothetical protein
MHPLLASPNRTEQRTRSVMAMRAAFGQPAGHLIEHRGLYTIARTPWQAHGPVLQTTMGEAR